MIRQENMVIRGLLSFLLLSLFSTMRGEERDLSHWVNPFIGASTNTEAAGAYHGLGKTYPGATTPFGMVQVSPQTITGGDNASGYSDEHTTIEGFSFTQMSGVGWYGDMGNLLVMPTIGKRYTSAGVAGKPKSGWRSTYDKATETASAGYYSVLLTDYSIRVETTASTHCGAIRFTFPQSDSAHILIDLARRVGGTSSLQSIHVIDNQTIEGQMLCTPEGGGWGNGDGHVSYTLYFHATLSKPMKAFGFWSAELPADKPIKLEEISSEEYQNAIAKATFTKGSLQGQNSMKGRHIGFYADYATQANETVEMKVSISYVDIEGARKNHMAEVAGYDFQTLLQSAQRQWNEALGCIEIKGGSEEARTVFYTALYHALLDPRVHQDVDGRYVGGDGKIHPGSARFTKRTLFSGWDVFRSEMPLLTILKPEVVNDLLNSLITMADESGRKYFERWELFNSYTGCMLGNPALSVLTDAYAKGLRNYDVDKAYQYACNSAAKFGNQPLGYTPGNLGLSYTLEYAYTDWCLSELARMLGYDADRRLYKKRSNAYKLLFDKDKGWFRPKDEHGKWLPWPEDGILKEWYGCMECNPLQQGWFVPHDMDGLFRLLGGKKKAEEKLDWMFAHTPNDMLWNAYYNHANEPVHFVPYIYNQLGKPWKTQRATRFICSHAYHNRVTGLVGNEDAGQMSAWYVLSALGIHPSCPGQPGFEITSPIFEEANIHLPNGNTFTIRARENNDQNIYIQSAMLNGKKTLLYIDYSEIVKGGLLDLVMGNKHQ